MKTFTFNFNNTSNNNSFLKSTDYSKTLDAIILTNIKKANPYLNIGTTGTKKNETIFINTCGIIDADYMTATAFLAKLATDKKKKDIASKFILGKTYHLANGTPIIFYDDEIQIGFDLYSYSDFADTTFIKGLSNTTKSLIINIYNFKL